MSERGILITFEGGEGVGKSTQIRMLADRLRAAGHDVLAVREPGGSRISEKIRALLLDTDNDAMDATTELFLYEAARAQVVGELIEPALAAGKVVLCDRYYDSTTAYQGYGRGLDLEVIEQLNRAAAGRAIPARTVILDLSTERGLFRATKGGADRVESAGLEFHERVREGFLAIAEREPDRVRVVDASGSREETAAQISAALFGLGLL